MEQYLVRIISLGCAKNFVDTEIAAGSLVTHGFGLTSDEADADMIFINTCAFLEEARKETAETIKSALKWKKKSPRRNRKVVVSGCIIEWDTDGAFRNKFSEVDAWCAIDSIEEIGKIASAVVGGDKIANSPCDKKYMYTENTPRLQLTPQHYAYIKLADGCDNCCSYCKIPSIRGALRSRNIESVVSEAENLVASGVHELILIAQDTSAFGRETDGMPKLAELVRRLDALDGEFVVRLMYLHPAGITDELIETLKKSKRVVKCLEMPLQHISDNILKSMRRHITGAAQRDVVRKLQDASFSLRTTFMTGFPGETQENFEELAQYIRESCFTRLGVFAYSPESGTPAAAFDGAIDTKTAEKRRDILMQIQSEISLERNKMLIGKTVDVIIDSATGRGRAWGRTFEDAPEIDNTVVISNAKKIKSVFAKVLIEDASEYELQGKMIND